MNQQQSKINIQINTSQVDFFNFGFGVEGNGKQKTNGARVEKVTLQRLFREAPRDGSARLEWRGVYPAQRRWLVCSKSSVGE